jgi:hypothetical protein
MVETIESFAHGVAGEGVGFIFEFGFVGGEF